MGNGEDCNGPHPYIIITIWAGVMLAKDDGSTASGAQHKSGVSVRADKRGSFFSVTRGVIYIQTLSGIATTAGAVDAQSTCDQQLASVRLKCLERTWLASVPVGITDECKTVLRAQRKSGVSVMCAC